MDIEMRDFLNIKCIDCMTNSSDLKVGDKFLTGNRMIYQKDSKIEGQEVSWYEVISVGPGGNISYTPRYGRLRKSVEENNGSTTSIRD